MKLSEKLSEIKQDESNLNRLFSYREALAKQEFKLSIPENMTVPEREKLLQKFTADKKAKIDEATVKIDELRAKIVADKNQVNKRNVELGLDKQLIEMKYLRLELSRLMSIVKTERYGLGRIYGIDVEAYDALGISDRIKKLEHLKNKLDAQIQFVNWSKELMS